MESGTQKLQQGHFCCKGTNCEHFLFCQCSTHDVLQRQYWPTLKVTASIPIHPELKRNSPERARAIAKSVEFSLRSLAESISEARNRWPSISTTSLDFENLSISTANRAAQMAEDAAQTLKELEAFVQNLPRKSDSRKYTDDFDYSINGLKYSISYKLR